jgi:hypothetical protein
MVAAAREMLAEEMTSHERWDDFLEFHDRNPMVFEWLLTEAKTSLAKGALRADIDESAWASLYRTESRPFPPPETGKIAVKVINHYGDEVMKVYEVA